MNSEAKSYTAKATFWVNGQRYDAGATISLSDRDARYLVQQDKVELSKSVAPKKAPAPKADS
ncbi:MAG: hypothetical protein SFY80_03065 [Verrucomicrobiota bacterium]|nr:hypothetical protein [Verrucomicrobiota bacterium]